MPNAGKGTKVGVIKCGHIAGVSDKLEAKMIEEMRGFPWQPFTNHTGVHIRTHIEDDCGGGGGGGDEAEGKPAPRIDAEEYPEQEGQVRAAMRAQALIDSHVGQTYSFYGCARAVSKYGTHLQGARGASLPPERLLHSAGTSQATRHRWSPGSRWTRTTGSVSRDGWF